MTTNYRTNKHVKNKSVEEKLERAINALEGMVEHFEADESDNSVYFLSGNVADAKNLDESYKRVCDCITKLERFRDWLNLPNC